MYLNNKKIINKLYDSIDYNSKDFTDFAKDFGKLIMKGVVDTLNSGGNAFEMELSNPITNKTMSKVSVFGDTFKGLTSGDANKVNSILYTVCKTIYPAFYYHCK